MIINKEKPMTSSKFIDQLNLGQLQETFQGGGGNAGMQTIDMSDVAN
jgi:hypothetical protein